MPRDRPRRIRRSDVEAAQRKLEKADRLRQLERHPTAVAMAVGRTTAAINWLMWAGVFLGVAFSTVNVHSFASAGATVHSIQWWSAWLFEPFINLVLVAVLLGQQVCARYRITIDGAWPTATKWITFSATLLMNVWHSFNPFDLAGFVLHLVPPVIVLCAAEAAPVLTAALAQAVGAAERAASTPEPKDANSGSEASTNTDQNTSRDLPADTVPDPATGPATGPAPDPDPAAIPAEHDSDHAVAAGSEPYPSGVPEATPPEPAPASTTEPSSSATSLGKPAPEAPVDDDAPGPRRRPLRQDFVAVVVNSWEPGDVIDRKYVISKTGCSAGIATEVAADALKVLIGHRADPTDNADPGPAARRPRNKARPEPHNAAASQARPRRSLATRT